MTLELFDELSDVFSVFIKKFTHIPTQADHRSVAWKRFHYNYFDSMTSTVYNSLSFLNYASIREQQDNIQSASSFAIALDKDHKLVSQVNFDKLSSEHQRQILKAITNEIPIITKGLAKDRYQFINLVCPNTEDKLCRLCGTIYIDAKTNESTINLFYLHIISDNADSLQEVNLYMKDKEKYKKLYQELAINKINTADSLNAFLQSKDIALEDFHNDFVYFFGEEYLSFYDKKRFLNSLELTFFSKNTIEEIASICDFRSTASLLDSYKAFEASKQSPIMRYSGILNKAN